MKVCIATQNKDGLQAKVKAHFGSAEFFTIYDSESNSVKVIENTNIHHAHGMCKPLGVLSDENIDAVVCGGVGARAVMKLNQSGIKVYRAQEATVSEVIESLKKNALKEISPENSCQAHSCGPGK